jgi:GxxExxY protein
MPVIVDSPIEIMSQAKFGHIAYEVVGRSIEIYRRLGSVFHESVYHAVLQQVVGPRSKSQVSVHLQFETFEKEYFLDFLVDCGALFELKRAEEIHDRHRAQIIQYMMLTGIQHSKIINFGATCVTHEFVNCLETVQQRRLFTIEFRNWPKANPYLTHFQQKVTELIRDWGTGLQTSTYAEAISHLCGDQKSSGLSSKALWNGEFIASQRFPLVLPDVTFRVTSIRGDTKTHEDHFRRLLGNTDLKQMIWVNFISDVVRFTLLADDA